ncbi:hypothetical protein CcCBS67573_g00215 [Chytriomyces confervae]|uniref:DUF4436 domain-containing protein n=1 Tax=Chytriomyces confervae TaxID=246404 RepID=A0A507FTE8_9FUNG|nr:hypothetical protein HDU80_005863 [Chytriomyces hyalinus]TPX78518.1 hypothetical protein CcCBS67573_g00215 [Chytriomyces confervae]
MLLPRARLIRYAVGVFLTIAAIIGGLTAVALVARSKQGDKYSYYVASPTINGTSLIIGADVQAVDVLGGTMKVLYTFETVGPIGKANPSQIVYDEPAVPINVTIGAQAFSFKANQPMLWQTGSLPIFGDYNDYPFDNFTSLITMSATYGSNQTLLPITLQLSGVPNGFEVAYAAEFIDGETYGEALIVRNSTVKTFAMLIMITMWFLAIASATFAVCLHAFEKKVEGPFVAFTIALLFAMPGVRNTMPAAPPVGCLADQMVLVWVMVILAICVLYYFVKLISGLMPAPAEAGKP